MGMGLESAYGLSALEQLKEKVRAQLAAQQQQQFQNQLALRGADRADAGMVLAQQQRGDALAETKRQHDLTAANQQMTQDLSLAELTPPGSINATNPVYGQLKRIGAIDESKARPAVDVGPLLPGDTGAARDAVKLATAKQQDTAADNARAEAALKQTGELQDWKNSISQQLADAKSAQAPTSSYQLQPEIDPTTGQQTGRFLGYNTKANRWEPVQGQGPGATKAAPGASQAAQHEASRKEALGSLDQLDQAIESAKDLIGPGAGRISHIEQLVGNPDPRVSALGTKLLLTKMQVDHAATGTVRAGASPQLLARWDNLMSQNLTPENLKAAVQAMREIIGGSGGGATSGGGGMVSMVSPDGRVLSVPSDKVAELEKLGAKRR